MLKHDFAAKQLTNEPNKILNALKILCDYISTDFAKKIKDGEDHSAYRLYVEDAFNSLLRYDFAAKEFLNNTNRVISTFNSTTKYVDQYLPECFKELEDLFRTPSISKVFITKPKVFASIFHAANPTFFRTASGLKQLLDSQPEVAKLFETKPEIFALIAESAGESTSDVFFGMLDIHAFAGESAKKLLETSPEMYLSIAKFSRGNARSVFDTLIEKLQDDSLTKKLLENPKLFTDIFEFLIRKTKKLDLSMNAVTFITLAIINDPNSTNPKTIETLDNLLDAFSMQDSKTTKEIFQDLVLFSRHPEKIPVMLSFYNRLVTISDKKAHSPTGFIGLMQVYPEIKANIKNIFTNLIENNVDLEKDHIFDLLWLMRITNVVPNKAYEYLHQQYLKIPKGSSLSLEQALLLNIESDISLAELLKRFKIDLGISKPKDIEDVRLRINNIDPILGDRFLYLIVQNLVSNTKAISDVNNSIKYAEYLMARPSNNSDVNTYYRNLAKFLINRIVKLVMSEKSIDPELLKDISQRLSSLGVNIPKKQGRATKFLKYIFSGQAGQAVGKATKKLNPLATKSIARFSPDLTTTESPLPIKMRDGSTVSQVSIAGYNIDILAIRSSKQKSKVGFEVNVGGGVSVPNQLRPIALAVGAYTTGRGKPTEFCAMNGKVVNDLISNREGLLIISANGEATIEDINTILSGFDIEKWEQFLKKIKNQQLSVMQQHLLLYQNEIALSPVNSSHVRDNRRIFVTTNDSYMILDVKNVTLYEAALIAKKLGGISAVNLDTGYYDYAAYYDSKDTPTFIGTMDSGILSGASNLVYIYPK